MALKKSLLFMGGVLLVGMLLVGCNKGVSIELLATPGAAADLQGAGEYQRGDEVTVRAIPKEGWVFVAWILGDAVVAETSEYTFVPQDSSRLTAVLEPLQYAVSVLAQGQGTFNQSQELAIHGQAYTVTAAPQAGYRFACWLEQGEVVSKDAEYSFVPAGDRELTALFLPELALEYDERGGRVEETWAFQPSPKITLTAVAKDGYEFFDWIDKTSGQELNVGAEYSFSGEETKDLLLRFRKVLVDADGGSLIAVVGKQSTIGKYAPSDLVTLPDYLSSKRRRARKQVAEALEKMSAAAQADGVKINVDSGYRGYDEQNALFNRYAKRDGVLKAERYSARPGQSEHQLGTAMDFGGTNRDYSEGFADTSQGKWLLTHAHEYGFALSYPQGKEAVTGYQYEPWHYRFIGEELAREWKDSGLTLIEFLEGKNQAY